MAGTFTNLLVHTIFSTKKREPLIEKAFESELYAYLGGIVRGEGGELLCAGGMPDHVHLLARVPPKISISDMLQHIKGGSSRWINEEGKLPERFAWQEGYSAFAVSESVKPEVMRYIQNQKEHHRKITFREELLLFLDRHGVEYDTKYIWK